jgi:aspartyl-tRNA(Asn)/glutamyl-tRNA(Gln) amidotransferase subunit A
MIFGRSLEQCEAAIRERNDSVRAILEVVPNPKKAPNSRENTPISGVAYSLKDTWDTAGIKTTGGSWRHRDRIPERSSKIFSAFENAGAILIGKSNLCDMAFSLESDNHIFGPVRNPWDPTRTSGGSTGGGAAAIAAGMSNFDWGSDFGGSIRMPAALCGVAGIRLSHTTWPIPDFFPVTPELDVELHGMGPLAKNVAGLRAVLDAVRDDLKTGVKTPIFKADRVALVIPDGPTIGEWPTFVSDAERALKKIGATIDEGAKTPSPNKADKLYDAYLSSNFLKFLEINEMPTPDAIRSVVLGLASWGKLDKNFHPNTALLLGIIALGRGTLHRDPKATKARVDQLQNTCNEIWSRGTLLVSPTTTFPAPHHGRALLTRRLVAFAKLGNLIDATAVAVPFGKFSNGLPRSMQVLGPAGSEEAVLDLGEKLEAVALT